ncbi:MAG TPA: hypothetical protein VFS44_02985 [Gemmatimonadaceae bacterium]|nr:hypothetical protein [Gemmatimonadaceae bacterium]
MPSSKVTALVGTCLVIASACGRDATAPPAPAPGPDSTDPSFIRARADAPQLTVARISFWATRAEERTGALYFRSTTGDPADSTQLVRLTIPRGALARLPDGSRVGRRDSVQITMTLVDPEHMIVEMEPSGLRFSNGHPAHLDFGYEQASDDIDGDGQVDGEDQVKEAGLRLWRRETPGDPWLPVGGSKHQPHKHIDGDIEGFTQYAIAY